MIASEFVEETQTIATFYSIANSILADAANATNMGGAGYSDVGNESYATTLKCHDKNGELYNVVFSCDSIRLNSNPNSEDGAMSDVEKTIVFELWSRVLDHMNQW